MAMFTDVKSAVTCISLLQVQGVMVTASQDKQIRVSGQGLVLPADTVAIDSKRHLSRPKYFFLFKVHFGQFDSRTKIQNRME